MCVYTYCPYSIHSKKALAHCPNTRQHRASVPQHTPTPCQCAPTHANTVPVCPGGWLMLDDGWIQHVGSVLANVRHHPRLGVIGCLLGQ